MKRGDGLNNDVDKNRHVSADDVGIIFQGNYNAPGEGPTVVMQLATFRRLTGIDASGPAMAGICRLLEEDVKVKQLELVWGDELTFKDGAFRLRVWKFAPGLAAVSYGTFVTFTLLFAISAISSGGMTGFATACFLACMAAALVCVIVAFQFYRPYMVCKRIAPVLDEVNADLPGRIDAWRKGLRV